VSKALAGGYIVVEEIENRAQGLFFRRWRLGTFGEGRIESTGSTVPLYFTQVVTLKLRPHGRP